MPCGKVGPGCLVADADVVLMWHRSLLVAQELLNCKVIFVIHHTDCVSPFPYASD